MKHTYKVTGMTCNHCVHSVQRLLQSLDDVTGVQVSLEPPQATIEADQDYALSTLNAYLAEKSNYQLLELDADNVKS